MRSKCNFTLSFTEGTLRPGSACARIRITPGIAHTLGWPHVEGALPQALAAIANSVGGIIIDYTRTLLALEVH